MVSCNDYSITILWYTVVICIHKIVRKSAILPASWRKKLLILLTNNILFIFYLKVYIRNMTTLSLWKYASEIQWFIENLGGKLWFLEFLRKNPTIANELKKIGIHIAPWLQILNKDNTIDWLDFKRLSTDAINNSWLDSNPFVIIRGSVPGDFRSLVDVIPTQSYPIHDIKNAVWEGISRIIEWLWISRGDIEKYARWMNVPYDENILRIWVAPFFHIPILTATEHPNDRGTILLDTCYGEYAFGWHDIQTVNFRV